MDFQPGILANLPDPDSALDRAAAAIAAAREAGATVGYVRVAFTPRTSRACRRPAGWPSVRRRPAQGWQPTRRRRRCTSGSRRARGTSSSARRGSAPSRPPTWPSSSRARGVDTIVLAGISTSGVVLSTVRDGHDRDYRVIVLADASADPKADVHEFLITEIFPRQAEVITVEELGELLALNGDHPGG